MGNPIYTGPSASPVKIAQSKSTWALAADWVGRIDGQWAGFGGSQFTSLGSYALASIDGAAPHQRRGTRHTDRSSVLMVDGSVSVYKWEELRYFSSWANNGTRMFYWYQRDLPEGMTGNVANLAPAP